MIKTIKPKCITAGIIMLLAATIITFGVKTQAKNNSSSSKVDSTEDIILSTPIYENTSKKPCYVRLKIVNPTYSDTATGECYSLFELHTGDGVGMREDYWVYSNGYYYYKNVLNKGDKTVALYDFLSQSPRLSSPEEKEPQTIIIAQVCPVCESKDSVDAFRLLT